MRAGGGDESFPLAGSDSLRTLKALDDLSKRGKFIWPHPTTLTLAAHKSINTLLYGESIVDAGGVAEGTLLVHTRDIGIDVLERQSHVVKTDWTAEYRGVVMPKSARQKSGRGALEKAREPIRQFKDLWKEGEELRGDPFAPRFFAVPYNDAMISLGEVRVYFANGKIVEMLHTVSYTLDAQRWEANRVSATRTAPLKNIQ